MSLRQALLFFLLLLSFGPTRAHAITLDPTNFSSPLQLLSDQAASASAKTLGLGVEFRPLTGIDPPTSLLGIELGVSAQVAKVPDDFREVLATAGYSNSVPAMLPAARIQANLRLSDRVAFEGGWLNVNDFKLLGVALKVKIIEPEEGFGTALRIAYTDNDLGVISSRTWTPSILFGSKMVFAEPYVGAAYSFATATVAVPVTVAGITQTVTATGHANGLSLFGGLVFDLAILQIAFEGNYSNAGVPGLAARVGLRF